MQSIDSEVSSHKKIKLNSVYWSNQLLHILAASVLKHKAYLRTEVIMEMKWTNVKGDLLNHPSFIQLVANGIVITTEQLKKRFERMQKDIIKKFALEEEGANLSGLPEESEPHEELVIQMIREMQKQKGYKAAETAKKAKRNLNMLAHEAAVLPLQTKINSSCNLANDISSGSDLSSKSSAAPQSAIEKYLSFRHSIEMKKEEKEKCFELQAKADIESLKENFNNISNTLNMIVDIVKDIKKKCDSTTI
jgi:hypothetical protein